MTLLSFFSFFKQFKILTIFVIRLGIFDLSITNQTILLILLAFLGAAVGSWFLRICIIKKFQNLVYSRRFSILFFLLLTAIIYLDCYSVYSLFPNSFCDEEGGDSAEQDGIESANQTEKEADEIKGYALIIILVLASWCYLYFTGGAQ